MLAGKANLAKLKYPLYASPKLDGVRGIVWDATLRSRTWKEFPNEFVQDRFSNKLLNRLDGELILGDPAAKDVYRTTNAALQRESGKPDVKFYVFDLINEDTYEQRRDDLWLIAGEIPNVITLESIWVRNESELLALEERYLALGYEGLILRSPSGLYKYGRASENSQELLKLKRFEDSEAEVIDFYEEMHNGNKATKDAFGRTERSSHKANLVGKSRLGGLIVRDVTTGVEFSIGSGFTEAERIDLWNNKTKLKGQYVKYKYFSVGVKDKPRHPVYLGPRNIWDF